MGAFSSYKAVNQGVPLSFGTGRNRVSVACYTIFAVTHSLIQRIIHAMAAPRHLVQQAQIIPSKRSSVRFGGIGETMRRKAAKKNHRRTLLTGSGEYPRQSGYYRRMKTGIRNFSLIRIRSCKST
jgi:hypothetical protein